MKTFEWIKWDQKRLKDELKKYLSEIKENIKKIKKIKREDRNLKNSVLALDYLSGEFHNLPNILEVLVLLSPKKEIRKKANELSAKLSTETTKLIRDKKLYEIVSEYKKNKKEKLDKDEEKFLNDTIFDFERMGFALKGKKEKKLLKILKELSKLELKFSSNIAEYQGFIEIEEKDLEDLPENFRNTLKKEKNGKYKISIEYTQMLPFIENSTNQEKRKELIVKASKKGGQENLDLLVKILDLRRGKAKLLGYKNHAEFVLAGRMAKKPEVVEKFENDLVKKIRKKAKDEMKELVEFKNKLVGGKKEKINFYDFAFYAKKFELEKFSFDEEKIREYFALEKSRQKMFQLFGGIFGLEFKKKKASLWEKPVELFEVFDKKSKEKISEIAFDLFPREGKHPGAFMTPIINPFLKNEKYPVIVISANFRKATKEIPSLLSLSDLETLFHEFGHTLHGALSKVKIPSQFGTAVKWDFVETPSQLLENWLNDEKILKEISSHWKSGKKIGKKDLENIVMSKKFLKANGNLRQLEFGILDFVLHTKGSKKPEKLYQKKQRENNFYITENKESLFPASFGHLMGYDAGYYSYMWALVMADDIFSVFKDKGLKDKKIGMKYRKEILEVGSSRTELESVEKFLERKFSNKAFLKKILE